MHLTDPFLTRTITRHVLVRAENFIEHARSLRRPLKDAGYDTRAFHQAKEAYASNFDEYFKLARHRLGAHVQDFDFGKRIELWNDIEIVKVSYFVDGAQEIYKNLAALALPGYVAYAEPAEVSDPGVLATLGQLQRTIDGRNWVEMGTDPLAMTRGNTIAVLNTTPVHARAGQLALIRRWIALQLDLREKFVAYHAIARIFRARIITDIVSFCDCLVTRSVAPGAFQEMDGLDKLVQAESLSSAPIDSFVAASHFEAELAAVRAIRDKVGGHIESDETYLLVTVLADLDCYDLDTALAFYRRVGAAFNKLCFTILFLRVYAADGNRLYGVSMGQSAAKPYAGGAPLPQARPPAPPPVNDEDAYRKNLTRWLDGDENQKGGARAFFWSAFMGSDAMETTKETERFGGGERYSYNDFRKVHAFLLKALNDGLSDFDFKGVLELILFCQNGAPYPLAELLVRHGQHASTFRQYLICRVLCEIGSAPHQSASDFLEAKTRSGTWAIRLAAVLARFQTFVKNEGLLRINHKGQTKEDYDALVASLTGAMSPDERLICLLAFAGILSGRLVGAFAKPFDGNYVALKAELETLCLPHLKYDAAKTKAGVLRKLIETHDYVGVCGLVAIDLDGGDKHPLFAALVDNCCNGTIATAAHDQAMRHLAMCFVLKKDHRSALEIAAPLAARNPDWTDAQILVAQILSAIEGSEADASDRVRSIRSAYKLTPAQEAALVTVETEIQRGAAP